MPPSDHRYRARLRRFQQRLSLRNRLVLSHVMVLLLALLSMAVTSALIEEWLGLGDIEGDVVLQVGLWLGLAAAVPVSIALSRFLLRPLDRVRTATRRLAEGHYDDVLELPGEPGLAALVDNVNMLSAALADTERRRARLISEVAHEMRTPITILRGQIEGMADGVFLPDEAMFASLADDLDRLQRLTGDLSSLSRAEEGAFDLHRELTDVTMVARKTAERLRPQYDDQLVNLVVDPGLSALALCDPDRITQVLVNLLGNALAACDPHGRVALSVHTESRPGNHLIVRVTDDGVGIAEHDLERIFHRFERLEHPGRPAAAGGSGIGLAIARGIARAHGGDITAESAGPGKGATFTMRLPQEPAPGGAVRPVSR
ncbi:HAMP domain-containing sensor histidine kinase [Promicromonospora sp. NPDC023805]|uniref:sensor histidine kinase n=1 Tax=Promicromonospora sp. NPDC023805 TaxID=3154696 RepID=UPI0033EA7632